MYESHREQLPNQLLSVKLEIYSFHYKGTAFHLGDQKERWKQLCPCLKE